MAIGTLSVISWAEQAHGLAIARTMGMITFALFNLFFSIESKDERDSAFSLDTFSGKTFVITTSVSFVLLVLSTVLGIFHTVMTTTRLDVRQWLICTTVALSIVAAAEIRKPCGGGPQACLRAHQANDRASYSLVPAGAPLRRAAGPACGHGWARSMSQPGNSGNRSGYRSPLAAMGSRQRSNQARSPAELARRADEPDADSAGRCGGAQVSWTVAAHAESGVDVPARAAELQFRLVQDLSSHHRSSPLARPGDRELRPFGD
jgi:hypothetical protein